MEQFFKPAAMAAMSLFVMSSASASDYAGATGFQQAFDKWTVNCDEKLLCVVDSFATLPNGDYFRLALERDGKPDSAFTLIFEPQNPPAEGGKVRFRLPEPDYGMFGTLRRAYKSGDQIRFPDFPVTDNLFVNLPNATYGIGILEAPNGDSQEAEFWLNGLTAALIFIDNHQGRIGRQDAVVAKGGQPSDAGLMRMPVMVDTDNGDADSEEYRSSQVTAETERTTAPQPAPEPAPAPQATRGPASFPDNRVPIIKSETIGSARDLPRFVREAVEQGPGCQLDDYVGEIGGRKLYITDQYIIWELPCYLAAYQASFVYVNSVGFGNDMSASVMYFYQSHLDGSEENEITSPEFDLATSTLTSWAKGRGMGDCGQFQTYHLIYAEGDIVEFDLREHREKQTCDGVETEPTDYPLVWQSPY